MKYFANFLANGNTYYRDELEYTNKKTAIAEIRSIANANRFAGNECNWSVYDDNGKCVAGGGTFASGLKWRTPECDLKWFNKD